MPLCTGFRSAQNDRAVLSEVSRSDRLFYMTILRCAERNLARSACVVRERTCWLASSVLPVGFEFPAAGTHTSGQVRQQRDTILIVVSDVLTNRGGHRGQLAPAGRESQQGRSSTPVASYDEALSRTIYSRHRQGWWSTASSDAAGFFCARSQSARLFSTASLSCSAASHLESCPSHSHLRRSTS